MRHDLKAVKPVVLHHGEGIQRHVALGVIVVLSIRRRTHRIAITAQIHHHHGEMLFQLVRHQVPHDVRLRVTVQQQQGRTLTAAQGVQRASGALNLIGCKSVKHDVPHG